MVTHASVTVIDKVPHTAEVSPAQAAAYCRAHPKLAGWEEAHGEAWWTFSRPSGVEQIAIPARADFRDYARCMRDTIEDLVALGCASQPSEVLRAMAAIEVPT